MFYKGDGVSPFSWLGGRSSGAGQPERVSLGARLVYYVEVRDEAVIFPVVRRSCGRQESVHVVREFSPWGVHFSATSYGLVEAGGKLELRFVCSFAVVL